jgi:hypothetical protein
MEKQSKVNVEPFTLSELELLNSYLVYPSSAFRHVTQFQDVDHVEVNDIKYFTVFIVRYRNPVRSDKQL